MSASLRNGKRPSMRRAPRVVAGVLTAVLSAAAACRPSAPSSPSETAAQFYTLLDGLGVRGVPDSLALDAVRPYLDTALVQLLIEARQARDSVARLVPREKPPFIDGDLFSSLFEGNTSFGIRRVVQRGDTTFAVMAFTNAMQPPTVRWTDTLVIVPRANPAPKSPQFVIADLRYGAAWDFGNRGTLLGGMRAALSVDSTAVTPAACATPPCGTAPR
ncbi:MAG: hypothetical protein P3C09_08385 [Gemmatimonadota bacterium]|jgi:hypothetical protein|nr:hypothetical protein [Gemmatimonadota bacterium]MDQ8167762.1 hypothetical protein [Gemmatimonadota bacterium]